MNVESLNYSLLASALGILIVFLSLCGLSLLMVILKTVFGERENKQPRGEEIISTAPAVNANQASAGAAPGQSEGWIAAAVAAFLLNGDSPSALKWAPGSSEKSDSWMNRTAFEKKLG